MIRSVFEYILLFIYNILYYKIDYKKQKLEPSTIHVVTYSNNIFDTNITFDEEDNGPIWF